MASDDDTPPDCTPGQDARQLQQQLDTATRVQQHLLSALNELQRSPMADDQEQRAVTLTVELVRQVVPEETTPRVLLALADPDAQLRIHADSCGEQVGKALSEVLGVQQNALLDSTLVAHHALLAPFTLLPLWVGEHLQGVVFVDVALPAEHGLLLELFASQLAATLRNAQLFRIAAIDPLTGTYARRFFDQWLLREVALAQRAAHPLSLLMIDMDGMKKINDSAGHLVGDRALMLVGQLLQDSTRDHDVVSRYGGDEFVVILPREGEAGALDVAERISARLKQATVSAPSSAIALRSSVGVATLQAPDERPETARRSIAPEYFVGVARSLIAAADAALYQVKRAGGGGVHSAASLTWPALHTAEN